jgi:hypothetical protein
MAGQAGPSSAHDERVLAEARAVGSMIRARRRKGRRWGALLALAAGVLLVLAVFQAPWRWRPASRDAGRPAVVAAPASAGSEKVAFRRYQNDVRYLTRDRPDLKQVRDIYASVEAARPAKAGQPLPSGAVLTMVFFKAKVDETGELVKDPSGRLVKGELERISVMEKRTGWGTEHADDVRNGEWEYAQFRPDGTRDAKANIQACLQCHKPKSGQDFVFTLPELARASK